MIMSHGAFMLFCTLCVASLSVFWLVWDSLRLRRILRDAQRTQDEVFGSVIGIGVALWGISGVVLYHTTGSPF